MEAIYYLISAGLALVFLFMVIVRYIKYKYQFFLYLVIAMAGMFFWALFEGISLLILSIPLHILGIYFMYVCMYAFLLGLDILSKNVFGMAKYALYGAIIGAGILSSLLDPNAVEQFIGLNGDERLYFTGTFELLFILSGFIWMIYMAIGIVRLIRHSPPPMKKKANLLYMIIILQLGLLLLMFFEVIDKYPGIDALIISLMIFFFIITFYREPRLAFILPFKVLRLTVIHTESGIPLFVHHWKAKSNTVDDVLYSGMVQGICMIIKETSDQGDIEEIKLSNGVLLLKRHEDYPIVCVLTTTNSSIALRKAINHFIQLFIADYGQFIPDFSNVSNFGDASRLIKKCFAFVPDYE